MKALLHDWEDEFDSLILDRGWGIFSEGHDDGLIQIDKLESGLIEARVQGTYLYDVRMTVDKKGHRQMACQCPYAQDGNTCKHMAAVLYFVEHQYKKESVDDDVDEGESHGAQQLQSTKALQSTDALMVQLENLSKDQLILFLYPKMMSDSSLRGSFEIYLANLENDIKKLIKEFWIGVNRFSGRHGMIDYGMAPHFFEFCSDYASHASDMVCSGFLLEAIALIKGITKDFDEIPLDDSDGFTTEFYESLHDIVDHILDQEDEDANKALTLWLESVQDNRAQWYLCEVFSDVFDQLMLDEAYIDGHIASLKSRVFAERAKDDLLNYKWTSDLVALLNALVQKGQSDEALHLSSEYDSVYQVLLWRIGYYQSQGMAPQELQAIEKAISVYSDHRNYSIDLIRKLLAYWVRLGDRENIIKNHWKLVEMTEYTESEYLAYRNLFSREAWSLRVNQVFVDMEQSSAALYQKYKIYGIESRVEEMKAIQDKLLDYEGIKRYEKLYLKHDVNWLYARYLDCIRHAAQVATNRKQYKQVVGMMKHVLKLPDGKAAMADVAKEFKIAYTRRPAFMDELSKLKL